MVRRALALALLAGALPDATRAEAPRTASSEVLPAQDGTSADGMPWSMRTVLGRSIYDDFPYVRGAVGAYRPGWLHGLALPAAPMVIAPDRAFHTALVESE